MLKRSIPAFYWTTRTGCHCCFPTVSAPVLKEYYLFSDYVFTEGRLQVNHFSPARLYRQALLASLGMPDCFSFLPDCFAF